MMTDYITIPPPERKRFLEPDRDDAEQSLNALDSIADDDADVCPCPICTSQD
jgi:hypothetical protein